MTRNRWLITTLALCALGLVVPVITAGSAGLTFNLVDLAEWTSLHPDVRGGSPAMIAPLLLRLPLLALALCIAFSGLPRPLRALLAVGLAAALLPPPQFLRQFDDPNYRQLALLALVTLIGSAAGLINHASAAQRRWAVAAAAFAGAASAFVGVLQAQQLLSGFAVRIQPAIGVVALLLGFMGTAWASARGE